MKKQIRIKNVLVIILCLCFCLCPILAFADGDNNGSDTIEVGSEVEVLRISANQTSGLHAIILTLIGDYNPIAVTTAYQYPSGTGYTTRYQVDVEPDWSWIMTCALFIVVVWCTFKFIGGIFSK